MSTEERRDYVPKNPSEFRSFMFNLLGCINDTAVSWTSIPAERFKELSTLTRRSSFPPARFFRTERRARIPDGAALSPR